MKKLKTVKSLEELGRVRLSPNFFMRDFLHSEIAQIEGIPNIPDYPDIAIQSGSQLCEKVLEPIQKYLWSNIHPFCISFTICELKRG